MNPSGIMAEITSIGRHLLVIDWKNKTIALSNTFHIYQKLHFLYIHFIQSYDTSSSIDRQMDYIFTFNQTSKLLAYKVKVKIIMKRQL